MENPFQNREFPASVIDSLLIAEDCIEQRAHMVALARTAGVKNIHEASNGKDALQILEGLQRPPSVLMLDLEMPELDGIELIEQLAARGSNIPLLVVSAQGFGLLQSIGEMIEELDMPLVGVFRKPLQGSELRAALRYVVEAVPLPPFNRPFLKAAVAKGPTRSDLAQAIGDAKINVHYQPKVDMRDLRVVGVEALARWTHPELGEIPPDIFIPLAEREGLIHCLTMSVFEQAIQQASIWNEAGMQISMAMNLSPRLLDAPELVDEVVRMQQKHRVLPGQLVLEITESASASQFGAALGVLSRLRLKGFGLSIDDFGTGFSSMQQLARVPFTELKFDRSFVRGATRRENHRVILKSSLQMSRELGLVTVAEGIETIAEWRLLKSYGCDVGQGWLIARPMQAAAMVAWMASRENQPMALSTDP